MWIRFGLDIEKLFNCSSTACKERQSRREIENEKRPELMDAQLIPSLNSLLDCLS
jgi:hypothetical protein